MNETRIYEAIAKRTGGDIYVGVVGPVRTGKSTFIHRFIESVALPNIENEYDRARTLDEIPQSGSGKTITTTEPKFVPAEAVKIKLSDTEANLKMIDCVGYMVDGALGADEDGEWRMVDTPWSSEPIPFTKAAEIGTEKVVKEHSTIAVLVTTDGSFTEIEREKYIEAEERAARELTESGKPFVIVLNSAEPQTAGAHTLASELEEKYSAPVALVNCTALNSDDVEAILGLAVGRFPIKELCFSLPEWTSLLPCDHEINERIKNTVTALSERIERFEDVSRVLPDFSGVKLISLDAGCGRGEFEIPLSKEEFYSALSDASGVTIKSDGDLFASVTEMARIKEEYGKIMNALDEARGGGYGIVMPTKGELRITEPETVRRGSSYGVKIGAEAEALHIIKTRIATDICPSFGTEDQAQEAAKAMKAEFEAEPDALLDMKLFGRSLYELVNDGMHDKLTHMPPEARTKMGQTIEKIINEGASGLICILV